MRQGRLFAALLLAPAMASCVDDRSLGSMNGNLFGASVQGSTSGEAAEESAVTAAEQETGRHFDLDRVFVQWDNAAPGSRETWTIQQGRTPIVSFNTESSSATITWAEVASGSQDVALFAIADAFEALGAPTFCIFDHVPENDSPQYGSPDDFRAAYRHIVFLFRARQATNVVWIFNMKSPSFPDLADQFYPGDDVVDWIGASAYNFGDTATGGRWVSFGDLVADFVAWGTPHGKPLIVSEWASVEDSSDPQRKATWVADALVSLKAAPQIRALSGFWNMTDPDRFDSSPTSFAAFQAFAADPYENLRGDSRP